MLATGLVTLALIATFVVLYTQMPWWIDGSRLRRLGAGDQAGVLGNDRGDLMKIIAGAGGVVALLYTARRHTMDRAGQLTDRYSKAIDQIASDRLAERIGGIYALERIMADSPRDHQTVVEVLTALIRERAPLDEQYWVGQPTVQEQPPNSVASKVTAPIERLRRSRSDPPQPEGVQRQSADVEAAMTVLARRPQRAEPFALNLQRTDLRRVRIPDYAFFANADFMDADLSCASFQHADLSRAILFRANLTEAQLDGTNLTEANLRQANISKAYLSNATLTGAYLLHAHLAGTVLDGADLREATLHGEMAFAHEDRSPADIPAEERSILMRSCYKISAKQLAGAFLSGETKLDEGVARNEWIAARIAECDAFTGLPHMMPPTPEPTS